MRLLVVAIVGGTSLLRMGHANAEADSLEGLLGPREIAVGEAMRGGSTGASSIGMNPAGLPLNRELVFEGGYGYRASDSASLINASACDSTNAVPGCFFYNYAGSSPELSGMTMSRTTHVVGSSLSKMIVPRVMVGVTAKYFRASSNIVDEEKASGFSFDLGATVRLTELINLGVAGQNLWGNEGSGQFPRAIGGGLLARPTQSIALSFDSRWKTDGAGARYGGGGEWFIRTGRNGVPIRIGGLHDSGLGATYVTGGLGLATIKWGIDLAARREIGGGGETLVLASMRFFGPRLAGPGLDPP
jgi:hypothetical protein